MLRKLKFDESQQLLEQFTKKKTKSRKNENLKEKNDIYNNNKLVNLRIFQESYYEPDEPYEPAKYKILDINILGRKIEFQLTFYFNEYENEIMLGAKIDGEILKIKSFYRSSKGKYNFNLITIPFKLGIPLKISIKFKCDFSIAYEKALASDDLDIEARIDGKLDGSLSTNFPYINLEITTRGELFKIKGTIKYIAKKKEILPNISSEVCNFSLIAIVEIISGTYEKEICSI